MQTTTKYKHWTTLYCTALRFESSTLCRAGQRYQSHRTINKYKQQLYEEGQEEGRESCMMLNNNSNK